MCSVMGAWERRRDDYLSTENLSEGEGVVEGTLGGEYKLLGLCTRA